MFQIERRFPGKALELDIAGEFVDLLLIPLRTRVAENALEATKLKVASSIIEHATKTKKAFYEHQSSLQKLEMYRAVSKAMNASALAANKLYIAGNINELEMQNEQKLANEALIDLAIAENEMIEEREELNVLMGLWAQNIDWKIEGRLPIIARDDPDGRGLERLAVSERLDLASERKELDALGNNISLSGYGAILTEATLGYHSEIEPEGSSSRGPSISLPIPIFNQGSAQKAKAYAQFRQSAAHFMQHAIEIRSEVRKAFVKMRSARQRAEYFQREVLPLYAKMLNQSQLQYNGMFISVFQLLQAKRSQIEAGKDFIEASKEYWIAKADLELAVGGSIRDVPVKSQTIIDPKVTIYPKAVKAMHHHGG